MQLFPVFLLIHGHAGVKSTKFHVEHFLGGPTSPLSPLLLTAQTHSELDRNTQRGTTDFERETEAAHPFLPGCLSLER